eukprot:CAMPEP_0202862424 /NCGR_PEP_ID=MMETSP1391-20130828/3474_1 /ASSEMBLY_ACC=CAM_ASM_000867 /TAXON_ID=1034604 /ORGANISM="Chlamydomonas leiostraca, Strain SAG 11-49" /LENGTH=243 /DNA_ID=CAMNT_0049541961 /DNA_START=71 /DNA_END=802 /DNA_ORIENTATION=-
MGKLPPKPPAPAKQTVRFPPAPPGFKAPRPPPPVSGFTVCQAGGDPHVRSLLLPLYTCNDTGTITLSDNTYFTVTARAVRAPLAAGGGDTTAGGASTLASVSIRLKRATTGMASTLTYSGTKTWKNAKYGTVQVRKYKSRAVPAALWVTIIAPAAGATGMCHDARACSAPVALPPINATSVLSNKAVSACAKIKTAMPDMIPACAWDVQTTGDTAMAGAWNTANADYAAAAKAVKDNVYRYVI